MTQELNNFKCHRPRLVSSASNSAQLISCTRQAVVGDFQSMAPKCHNEQWRARNSHLGAILKPQYGLEVKPR